MTQQLLADRSGVSVFLIEKLETSNRKSARLSTLGAISRALNVPVNELLDRASSGGPIANQGETEKQPPVKSKPAQASGISGREIDGLHGESHGVRNVRAADKPRTRIRAERKARCWPARKMAEVLRSVADNSDSLPSVSLLIGMIRKWEAGLHSPSETYRLLYCKAFQMSEDELFGVPGELPGISRQPVGPGESLSSSQGADSAGSVSVVSGLSGERAKPNLVLRRIREQERHETRDEFAAAMRNLAHEMGEDVYPDGKYVARLEQGIIAFPRPLYRRILVQLCNRPISELGFTFPATTALGSTVPEEEPEESELTDAAPPSSRMNVHLRDAVMASGIEIAELARRIGVDPKSAQRWITQGRVPHPRHRWKACEILGCSESELWPGQVPQNPEALAGHNFRAPDIAEIDDMNRRELLRIMTMAGTLLAMGPAHDGIDWDRLDYYASHASRLDPQTVDEYSALNTHLWRVFVLSRTKHVVFPLVRDQLDVLTNSFERADGPEMYRRLSGLASSLFQLAGEILFDGNRYTDAAHCYTLAATASKEANMPDLWACALTRHAFISVYERRFEKSTSMLELAAALARRGDSALATRHWVAVVQAQTFAGLGKLEECQQALDSAEQVHNLQGEYQNGGWLRFDGSRLAEERGTCYIQLRRPDLAEAALTDALSLNLSVRRRGSVLTDLATLGAQRSDADQIVTYADPAVRMAQHTGSGVIVRKLKDLQASLVPFLNDSRISDLNARISSLSARSLTS
jgi:transcriptional regulator with XRE-family HTH domain